jgi:hypothetical protein
LLLEEFVVGKTMNTFEPWLLANLSWVQGGLSSGGKRVQSPFIHNSKDLNCADNEVQ